MTWSPEQYKKFSQPRLRPAVDLLQRIQCESPEAVFDLGCGTGNVTRLIRERWPNAIVTGVDASEEMLSCAKRELPDIVWQYRGIADWNPEEPASVVYSNAALQWLGDHETLFPRLISTVRSNGILAVQMPRNFGEPSHTLIKETACTSSAWKEQLEHLLVPSPVALPSFYYELLSPFCADLDIWETQYIHVLEGTDPVKEWTKGTWLRQFLEALDENDRPEFEAEYSRRLRDAYPPQADGRTLFPFRRLFIVAQRS